MKIDPFLRFLTPVCHVAAIGRVQFMYAKIFMYAKTFAVPAKMSAAAVLVVSA
ncbi:MAG: hypothetical protein O2944_10450 [Proteobacteria bacterium]|nr:hypothetical protein [Pseudomonadota bacterium]